MTLFNQDMVEVLMVEVVELVWMQMEKMFIDELLTDGNQNINDRSLRSSPTIESVAVTQGNEGLSKKLILQ